MRRLLGLVKCLVGRHVNALAASHGLRPLFPIVCDRCRSLYYMGLLLLALPLAAQAPTLVRAAPTPIGYWSLASRGTNPETGKQMQVVVIIHFKADSTFDAAMKTQTDGEEGIGGGPLFHGRWEVRPVFGTPMVCVKRPDMPSGVCHYSLRADGSLWFVDRPLTPHAPEAVKAIAPELVD